MDWKKDLMEEVEVDEKEIDIFGYKHTIKNKNKTYVEVTVLWETQERERTVFGRKFNNGSSWIIPYKDFDRMMHEGLTVYDEGGESPFEGLNVHWKDFDTSEWFEDMLEVVDKRYE